MKRTVFFVLCVLSAEIFAQCNSDYCGYVYVDKLYINPNGIIYIGTSGDETVLNCAALSGEYLTMDFSSPGGSAIYSTLLAAMTTNKQVVIQVADNSQGCLVEYVTMERN